MRVTLFYREIDDFRNHFELLFTSCDESVHSCRRYCSTCAAEVFILGRHIHLWNEYCERCRANGEIPYMSTQFSDKYRRWAKVTKATMRINHKPGETMQVDWAGGTIPYYDSVTCEEFKAYLFVAVLPCSGIIYVEACDDMKQENWLLCHVHAYEYFGGVKQRSRKRKSYQ